MEVIILAEEATEHKKSPKSMTEVSGKPFLHHIFTHWKGQGCSRFVVSVGDFYSEIHSYFGEDFHGVPLHYVEEDEMWDMKWDMKKSLSHCIEDFVFLQKGSIYFEMDVEKMGREKNGIVFPKNAHKKPYKKPIEKTLKKPISLDMVGVLCLDRAFFLQKGFEAFVEQAVCYEEKEGVFLDVSEQSHRYIGESYFDPCTRGKSVAFFDRDGTINVNYGYVYEREKLDFVAETPWYILGYNLKGVPVVVVTNQSGIARGKYSVEDMECFHQEMNRRLKEEYGAKIDRFYFCPHHPEISGDCDCRKPKSGMFLQAKKELELDFSRCIMYGDKDLDETASRSVGIPVFRKIVCEKNV